MDDLLKLRVLKEEDMRLVERWPKEVWWCLLVAEGGEFD